MITPLPTPPSTADATDFDARADAFVAALPVFVQQANQLGTNLFLCPFDYINGLELSTAGGSSTMNISAGAAADSTNSTLMLLQTALAKTTASWVPGNGGGLDTGAIANSTFYHFYEIYNPTTLAADIIFSTNPTLPALPAGYTFYRQAFSWLVDGSGHWVKGAQQGDLFTYDSMAKDLSAVTPANTNAVLYTLSTPPGIKCTAVFGTYFGTGANSDVWLLTCPDQADVLPSTSGIWSALISAGAPQSPMYNEIKTNTLNQIRARACSTASGAPNTQLYLFTRGYKHPRGRSN